MDYTTGVSSSESPSTVQFVLWLREQMDTRRWMPKNLAEETGITLAQVVNILSGKQSPGNKFLRGVAAAFNMPQATVFRLAGVLTDEEIEDVKEDEAARKISRLVASLDPEERERAVRLLEQYTKDHKRKAAPVARPAHSEA